MRRTHRLNSALGTLLFSKLGQLTTRLHVEGEARPFLSRLAPRRSLVRVLDPKRLLDLKSCRFVPSCSRGAAPRPQIGLQRRVGLAQQKVPTAKRDCQLAYVGSLQDRLTCTGIQTPAVEESSSTCSASKCLCSAQEVFFLAVPRRPPRGYCDRKT